MLLKLSLVNQYDVILFYNVVIFNFKTLGSVYEGF